MSEATFLHPGFEVEKNTNLPLSVKKSLKSVNRLRLDSFQKNWGLDKSSSVRTLPSLCHWTNFHFSYIKTLILMCILNPNFEIMPPDGDHSFFSNINAIFWTREHVHIFCQKYTFCEYNIFKNHFLSLLYMQI